MTDNIILLAYSLVFVQNQTKFVNNYLLYSLKQHTLLFVKLVSNNKVLCVWVFFVSLVPFLVVGNFGTCSVPRRLKLWPAAEVTLSNSCCCCTRTAVLIDGFRRRFYSSPFLRLGLWGSGRAGKCCYERCSPVSALPAGQLRDLFRPRNREGAVVLHGHWAAHVLLKEAEDEEPPLAADVVVAVLLQQ